MLQEIDHAAALEIPAPAPADDPLSAPEEVAALEIADGHEEDTAIVIARVLLQRIWSLGALGGVDWDLRVCQHGPQIVPSWSQHGPSTVQMASKGVKMVPKKGGNIWGQFVSCIHGPHMYPNAPQNVLKTQV